MKVILTHPNADFDAIASLLGAYKLDPTAIPLLPKRQNRNVNEFLHLYQNGLPFREKSDFDASQVSQVLLVDTQKLPTLKGLREDIPVSILDHHPRKQDLPAHADIVIDETGSNATLLVERLQAANIPINSLEATLLALGVYEDTGSLGYGTTTPRDIRAAAWLLEQKAVLDTVRRFLTPPLTPEQQRLYEILMRASQNRVIHGYNVMIATATVDQNIPQIASVAHRLRDALDPAALFVAVKMERYIQLVCRSAEDAIDVGEIARLFGGGGHERAAAAPIEDRELEDVVNTLWREVIGRIRPVTTVADLMSYGAHTVQAAERIGEIISNLRRIGHEGYPVLEQGRVVGLLRLREADRAMEHGLKNAPVRELMSGGEITLTPDDSVSTLEQTIVNSGWGQIPIVREGQLIGIVTRTDLIKHWAKLHPAANFRPPLTISPEHMNEVLGVGATALISHIAEFAQRHKLTIYMVGGVVRDLLLRRANDDLDFVLESDAIQFAFAIQAAFGGEVARHVAFGTAKWRLDAGVAAKMGLRESDLPNHIDFVTARNEFYEHPTALPTIYSGSIKLDLNRRDFTINTLAVQLSPLAASGRVLDFYGGVQDLHDGVIRVLHSLSFVDDPTRILRAVRFEQRLAFQIEARTAELIATSKEMLRRITGERIRHELSLLLKERRPEAGLLELARREVLSAIHPALTFNNGLAADFARVRLGESALSDLAALYWHIWLCRLPIIDLTSICERLSIAGRDLEALTETARTLQQPGQLDDVMVKPSHVVLRLDGVPEISLIAAAWITDHPKMRDRIHEYLTTWRNVRINTNGNTLKALGLAPGPRYKQILDRLRAAKLDGEIVTDQEEDHLLKHLLYE
ncbi:MAG: CBS domain-containing protein [Anaerolineae bacterium]|nr:CBS domain-containing protein [Anaerolineae bacterium]